MRISEAIQLRWTDLNLATDTIQLADESGSARRTPQAARTLKGGEGRVLPLNAELKPVLAALARNPDGFVFHGPAGGRLNPDLVRQTLIQDVLEPLATRFPTPSGEIGFADGRLHSFRHFFASLCANNGIAQRVVMRWLGHKDSRMVEHYYHLHDDESRRQMQRIRLADESDPPGREPLP